MLKKTILILLLVFFSIGIGFGQTNNIFKITGADSLPIAIDRGWKYHDGDNEQWASDSFNDDLWDSIPIDEFPEHPEKINWYRVKLHVDSAYLQIPMALLIKQTGASEIFLNGKKLTGFGIVSANSAQEVGFNPHNKPFIFNFENNTENLLAIRYSNHITKTGATQYAPLIKISKANEALSERYDSIFIILAFIDIAIGFFAGLTFLHLLLFFFYQIDKNNLYYCLFNLLALLILCSYHNQFYHTNSRIATNIKFLLPVLYVLFFYAVFVLSSRLFGLKRKWLHPVSIGLTIASLAAYFINLTVFNFLFISLIFNSCFSTIFIIRYAYRANRDGVVILGSGLLFGVLFILVMATLVMANNFALKLSGNSATLFFLFLVLAVISTPVSMSVYLARSFAFKSKTLTKKLIEVEELSAITAKQSKEKEEFLSSQNSRLEHLVSIRTVEVTEQKDKLEKQNEQLEIKSREIIDSLNYASRLQQVILPPVSFIQEKVKECFLIYKPKDIVAGDFYFAEQVGNYFFVAVADCTGHGVPGAMLSLLCSNALNQAVKDFKLNQPGLILDKTNELVSSTFEKSNQHVNDGMDISFLAIDSESKLLWWAGANNHLWYSNYGILKEIKANKQPIGKFENKLPFVTHNIPWQQGSMFYLITDGYADQFGGNEGKKYMRSNLFKTLSSIQDKPAFEQFKILDETFINWRCHFEQVDDVTIMGIRI